jgi:hypothetical protein
MEQTKLYDWWSEEETKFLQSLVDDGVTYKKAAAALNEKFSTQRTLGAVSGKCKRLRDGGKGRVLVKPAEPKHVPQKPPPKKKPVVVQRPIEKESLFKGFGVPLAECDGCRWPLERVNGVYTHCNMPIKHKSYCDHHYNASVRSK